MSGDRSPGWDAKVRTRAATVYGNLTEMADALDIPRGRTPMKTWSAIVFHFGGTANVERHLDKIESLSLR